MIKNTAGQAIGVQMVSATDGSAFTGTVTVYVTGDAGTQAIGSVGSGVCTHEGNGYHTYAPAQAETNYTLIAFTFIGTGAVPCTLQVYTNVDANVTQWLGTAVATPTVAGVPEVDVTHVAGAAEDIATETKQDVIDANVDAILVDTGTDGVVLANNAISSAKVATNAFSNTVFTTGYFNSINAEVDTALTDYDAATGTELAAVDTKIDTIDGIVDSILVDTGTTLPAQISALNDVSVSDILTTQMTESYAADGTAPTLAQALFLIQQTIGDFSITGTTVTTYKLDGTTAAATYTLDSSTAPTSRTRSS